MRYFLRNNFVFEYEIEYVAGHGALTRQRARRGVRRCSGVVVFPACVLVFLFFVMFDTYFVWFNAVRYPGIAKVIYIQPMQNHHGNVHDKVSFFIFQVIIESGMASPSKSAYSLKSLALAPCYYLLLLLLFLVLLSVLKRFIAQCLNVPEQVYYLVENDFELH